MNCSGVMGGEVVARLMRWCGRTVRAKTWTRSFWRLVTDPICRISKAPGPLDESGMPLHRAGISTTIPGLGYVGLEYQHNNASASLRGVGRDAAYYIKKLAG